MAKTVKDLYDAGILQSALRQGAVEVTTHTEDPTDPALDVVATLTIKDRDGKLPVELVAALNQTEGSIGTATWNFDAPEEDGEGSTPPQLFVK